MEKLTIVILPLKWKKNEFVEIMLPGHYKDDQEAIDIAVDKAIDGDIELLSCDYYELQDNLENDSQLDKLTVAGKVYGVYLPKKLIKVERF